ncbi:MAG: hypothetical protein E6772_10295 [Dysgonomonas sp.]|nr:hypothetical protein [Dysgonomonas sp.]
MYNKEIIQDKLSKTLSDNEFQDLCTDIIINKYRRELLSIEATGSQIGKNNTIKGVPDIYFYTENQKFVFIEATTQQTSLKNKFINDINGCLEKCKEKDISISNISSIYLMFTAKINSNIEAAVRAEFQDHKFDVKFIGIDFIIDDLMRYPFLLEEYLDISINIGYVLPINYFTRIYNKRRNSLGTPIDNPFFNREKELKDIQEIITQRDILIIKGDAGVGKTKLAVEAIARFCKDTPTYTMYAIGKNQSADITKDLYNRILKEKNIVLLIDDANQKGTTIENILDLIYKNTEVNIKLVLTVRQYAFQSIYDSLKKVEISFSIYQVDKFTKEELLKIISSDPFSIKDKNTQNRILDIALGNPRLAVMGAIAVKENPDIDIFTDALTLYDQYFDKTIVELKRTIKEKKFVQVLGLISTFNTIKLNPIDIDTQKICEVFEVNFKELKEIIEELEEKELLEIHPQFNRAKINEQITYTYFFYKLFINKKILSLETLLNEFYKSSNHHINYLINSVTDSFGEQPFIKETLKKYYQRIKSIDKEVAHSLFSSYWGTYLTDEFFNEVFQEIADKKPVERSTLFIFNKNYRDFGFYNFKNWGILLQFLSEKDNIKDDVFKTGLLLMLEYIRRVPELYDSFVNRIKTYRISTHKEVEIFFLHLINNRNDLLCKSLFYEFASWFLGSFGRGESKKYREKTWTTLFEYYQIEKDIVEKIIIDYLQIPNSYYVEVLNDDLDILIPFIEKNYPASNFRITYWLNEYFNRLESYTGINKEKYSHLIDKYITDEYKLYNFLDWDILNKNDKSKYRDELDYEAYDKAKTQEILKKIFIDKEEDFTIILEAIKNSFLIRSDYSELIRSVAVLLNKVLEKNLILGVKLVQKTIKDFPKLSRIIYLPINWMKTKNDIQIIEKYIEDLEGNLKIEAMLYFLSSIPDEFLSGKYVTKFIDLHKSFNSSSTIWFSTVERFRKFEPDIFNIILNIIIDLNDKGDIELIGYGSDIGKYIEYYDVKTLTNYYLQQKRFDNHFDNSNELFAKIFFKEEKFLIKYVEFLNREEKNHFELFSSEHLASIWNHPNIEKLIKKLIYIYKDDLETDIAIILNTKVYRLNEKWFLPLFSNLNDIQKKRALTFLLSVIDREFESIDIVNLILSISRQMGNDIYKIILHRFLDYHSDLETFNSLDLFPRSATIIGYGTFGDIYANRWKNIVDILEEYPNRFEVLPLLIYSKDQIQVNINQADDEREREYRAYR